ncbi:unnamed protein product [Cuscuta epithymum]|uniref:Wall-associated receptor kinase galacturonan-binding domain-containing protein n=1 Tax=Cuscuta epithymum TaxID=186058 RepID=A0AAV0DMI8_9ASTE|nr:unnamed protein product [Cuscuta epithymum]CAH9142040.1 unnamed protein product [Cuscuta epithymum]
MHPPIGLAAVSLQLASFILLLFSPPTIALIPPINAAATTTITKGTNITQPGCPETCGNVTVPYPFGVGPGCALDPSMQIDCNTTYNPPKPLIGINVCVYHISDSQVWISNDVVYQCYNRKGAVISQDWASTTWTDFSNYNAYTFSDENKFTVVGCDDDGTLAGDNLGKMKRFTQGCQTFCKNPEDVTAGSCEGTNGCCQYTIPKGSKFYNLVGLRSPSNHTQVWSGNPCGYAFIGEAGKFKFRGFDDLKDRDFVRRVMESVPIVLNWGIGNLSCNVANKSDGYACKENSQCVDVDDESGGYRCACNAGYEGNPYLSHGCKGVRIPYIRLYGEHRTAGPILVFLNYLTVGPCSKSPKFENTRLR